MILFHYFCQTVANVRPWSAVSTTVQESCYPANLYPERKEFSRHCKVSGQVFVIWLRPIQDWLRPLCLSSNLHRKPVSTRLQEQLSKIIQAKTAWQEHYISLLWFNLELTMENFLQAKRLSFPMDLAFKGNCQADHQFKISHTESPLSTLNHYIISIVSHSLT